MAHTNTWTELGLIRKFTGEISPEEILKSNFDLHVHPKFNDMKYIINDFTSVTAFTVTDAHTKVYASTDDMVSETKGKHKIAIVAEQEAHVALAKNYRNEMKNKFFKCEIFKTLKDAENWVKL